ncbi:MAG: cupin domain-containing protein [Candidatus Doudnabacteria bacterium]|jgi:mannose-6-phosphate isomerase-like protein (cupin superfamily)
MIDINYILSKYPGAKVFEDGFNVSEAIHSGQAGKVVPIVQKKRWGGEVWLIYNNKYALKILYISQGQRLSLQRHKQKEETWNIIKGQPEILLGGQTIHALPGEIYHVPPDTIHRLFAEKDDVEILEVSSPELWDLERIEDDYNRGQYKNDVPVKG